MTRPRPTRLLGPVLLLSLLVLPAPGRACGPGVHVREARAALALLVETDPEWALAAQSETALVHLALGAVGPDLDRVLTTLPDTHAVGLSYHLLDVARAEDSPEHRLFALGHLMHDGASDPFCEGFLTPWVAAAAPLGMLDLFATTERPEGETEGLVELYGDILLGDWEPLVDAAFDALLESTEARDRFFALVDWYCAAISPAFPTPIDCPAVRAELREKLAPIDELLGGLDRAQVHAFVAAVLAKPPRQLLDFVLSSGLADTYGAALSPSDAFDRELDRLLASPLAEAEFWTIYADAFAGHAAAFGLARLASGSTGWPVWNPHAMVSGSVQSVLGTLPDAYQPEPRLVVDDLVYEDANGNVVGEITSGDTGRTLRARVRFFAVLPLSGTVRGVVRVDRPGLDPAADVPLGEASLQVDLDPLGYVDAPRSVLEIPFVPLVEDARGAYVELYVDGSAKPWFSTSWDRVWTGRELELDRGSYRSFFDTYGHWPPSLPLAPPSPEPTLTFVKAHVAPAGGGIDLAHVTPMGGATFETGPNGIAHFAGLPTGPLAMDVQASGYAPVAPVTVEVPVEGKAWALVPLHAIPQIAFDAAWTADDCVGVSIDPAPFSRQAVRFHATPVDAAAGALSGPVVLPKSGKGEVCGLTALEDGALAFVTAVTEYAGGTFGVEGTGGPVGVDRSAPHVWATAQEGEQQECRGDEGGPFQVEIRLEITEPHSPIVRVEHRAAGGAWTDVAFELEAHTGLQRTWLQLTATANDASLGTVRVGNAAGLTSDELALVAPPTCVCLCDDVDRDTAGPPPNGDDAGPESAGAETVDASQGSDEGRANEGGGGGCSLPSRAAEGAHAGTLLLVALASLALRRRSTRSSTAAIPCRDERFLVS